MPIFNIRLTDSEMADLKGKAAAAEVPMTTYVRTRLFGEPGKPPPASQERARTEARSAQAQRDEVLRKMQVK